MTTPDLTAVRLSHPWQGLEPLAIVDLPEADAVRLIRAGVAVRLTDLVTPTGGGWYDVALANPRRIIRKRGLPAARRALERNSE